MSAHPGEDSTRGGTWSTGIDDAQQLVSRHRFEAPLLLFALCAMQSHMLSGLVEPLAEKTG